MVPIIFLVPLTVKLERGFDGVDLIWKEFQGLLPYPWWRAQAVGNTGAQVFHVTFQLKGMKKILFLGTEFNIGKDIDI